MDDYDRKRYRVIFMRILSAVLGLTFAVQVVVALATGHVTLMRTGRREVFREKSPAFFWINVGVSAGCAVVLIYGSIMRRRNDDT
jgi:hypothetical protein